MRTRYSWDAVTDAYEKLLTRLAAKQIMRSWVEVSLGQIRANYRAVRKVVGAEVDVMAVVKADAYRHGAPEVSRALEAEGAHWLAVSNVEEGVVSAPPGHPRPHPGDGGFSSRGASAAWKNSI